MGFFGTYLFDGDEWTEWTVDEQPDIAEPWLVLDIHDSDIATVSYRPHGSGSGTAFLGITPRIYFDDETASAPTDIGREADGLATWWEGLRGVAVEPAERAAKVAQIQAFLAADVEPDDADLDDADLDDADVFVEVKAGRFIAALGLPTLTSLPRNE